MEVDKPKRPKIKTAAQALSTWARLKLAGKYSEAGKPMGAEVMADNPDTKTK